MDNTNKLYETSAFNNKTETEMESYPGDYIAERRQASGRKKKKQQGTITCTILKRPVIGG